MPVAEVGNHLQLTIVVMELVLVCLCIQNGDAVFVKIGESEFFFGRKPCATELLITKVIDTDHETILFLVQ